MNVIDLKGKLGIYFVMQQTIVPLKNKAIAVSKALGIKWNNDGLFARRIKHRHNTFWKAADAETVRNITMSSNQPLIKWKDGKHWQRKLSNKYNSREFALLHDCRVPKLYWKGRNIDAIDFHALPPYYVIRPTIGHSSNNVFLMANSVNMMDKQSYMPQEIRLILSKALEENPFLEFLLEEFVRTEDGEYAIPDDYKFHMFNGEVATIEVINRLSPKEGFISYYDENWNMMKNMDKGTYKEASYLLPPHCLDQMIADAKRLSKTYEIFVRVDFYATDKGAVFGEFAPTPSIGSGYTAEAERLFIKYWDRYCKGKI